MRSASLLLLLTLSLSAHASWFGGDSSASSASAQATAWSAEQYYKAQQVFEGLKADAFDTWDESRLRQFLLEQGVIEPKGPREQLVVLAKQQYNSFTNAASTFSASATSLASGASASATSLASVASKSASSAAYGSPQYQVSKSISSTYAQATNDVSRTLEDTKDYVYSTWDDNRLRSYLEEKGVIKTKQQATRDEMLAKMKETYAAAANPVWQAWSDSYIREWLINHGLLRSDTQKTRDELVSTMNKYYYDTKEYVSSFQDTVYSSWSDSQMKDWLVEQGVIKSDAQLQREKLQKLVADNYVNAKDTVWGSWRESDMREWLIEHGYLKSDAQKTRDELIGMMHDKYNDYSARTAPYLVWPDARLRAYLREHGMSEDALPTSRPSLLRTLGIDAKWNEDETDDLNTEEVRIRWVQTQHVAESLYSKIKNIIMSSVESAEVKLGMILDLLTGSAEHAKTRANEKYYENKHWAHRKADEATDYANEKAEEARDYAGHKSAEYSAYAGEKVDEARARSADAESAGKKYWNQKVEDAKRAADHAKVEL